MKFTSTLVTLALAGAGLAAPSTCSSPRARLGRRDAATISLAMTDVLDKIAVFDAAMNRYQGGSDLTPIAESGHNMIEAIRNAGLRVSNTSAVASAAEATQFAPMVDRLTVAGEGLLARVVAQTVNFTVSGMCSDIYDCVNEIGQGVGKLMTEVSAKFPAEARYPTPATIQHFTDMFAATNARLQACAASVPRPAGSHVSLGPWPFHTSAPPTVSGTAVLPPAGPDAATATPAPSAAPAPAPAASQPAAGGEGAAATSAAVVPAPSSPAAAPAPGPDAASTGEPAAGSNAAAVAAPTGMAPLTGAASVAGAAKGGAFAVLVAACLVL